MIHKEIAVRLIQLLGGEDNVISAAHCATRLRLVIKDEAKIDQEKVEELEGVKGAFSSSGQYQIIFGTGLVNTVYEQFYPAMNYPIIHCSQNTCRYYDRAVSFCNIGRTTFASPLAIILFKYRLISIRV